MLQYLLYFGYIFYVREELKEPKAKIFLICKTIFGVLQIWHDRKLQKLSVFEDFYI